VAERKGFPPLKTKLSAAITLTAALAFLGLAAVTADPVEFTAAATQPAYWRYEVVVVTADGAPPGTERMVGVPERSGEPVVGVSGRKEVEFRSEDGRWVGRWAMPWDPDLGSYQMRVQALDSAGGELGSTTAVFSIRGKSPNGRIPLPHFAVTLETDADYYAARLGGPRMRVPGWKNIVAWPEYAGADSVWFCAGMTKAAHHPTTEHPWLQRDLDLVPVLARECHRAGVAFGAWIACFFPYGETRPDIPYEFSRNYVTSDEPGAKPGFWWTLNASLNCELRKRQIVELAQSLQAEPQVDYIGLDYIRSGPGGFELVTDMVTELGLEPYDGFTDQPIEVQMAWLVGATRSNEAMKRLWQWWRASKAARTLAEIKQRAGVTKPLWCFVLGWCHQHGQDPLMMTDAGADFVALMLYDATRNEFDGLMREWPKEYRDGRVNLVGGVIADPVQLANPYNPAAPFPLEMGNRAEQAIDGLAGSAGPWDDLLAEDPHYLDKYGPLRADGLVEGLFLHDLERMAYRAGGWTIDDYIVAGASAMSRLRALTGDIPVEIKVGRPVGVGAALFDVPVEVTNLGQKALKNIRVRTEPTRNASIAKDGAVYIAELAPGETVTVTPKLYAYSYTDEHVIAASAWWGGPRPADVAFACRYQLPWAKKEE
jgi:hypothetical protein